MILQHTVKEIGTLTGVGLHTGVEATVTINPAPEDYGIRFIRTDLSEPIEVIADIDNVVDNTRGTAIGKDDVRIYSIEHIMSALAGLEIDNCKIEVNAQEIPLMDGSALPFVELINKVGRQVQNTKREFIKIDKPRWLYDKDDTAISVFPADGFRITLGIDYKNPALGAQHTTLFDLNDYEKDFAPARTFCFLSEIEKLREDGLIKGGTINSAVVVQDVPLTEEHLEYLRELFNEKGTLEIGKNGFLNNTELHFPNELCRHKAVDLMGDLYLLGKPIQGHIFGIRTGHAANIELAKSIRKRVKERAKEQLIDYVKILELLPHRYPFLLVDHVLDIEPGKRIVATKNVSFNDSFFQGHFPDDPIMPGVLQVEAMAQAGGIMALYGSEDDKDNAMLFLGIDKARFRGQVHPGDILRIEVETIHRRRTAIRLAGKCFVKDTLVCEAEIMAMIGQK
jgi:UDP-3-O-[3-hydroxymyristoyl] N-acetylglucosamine deacetylase/3-hydroxyacyl-[acyl-carrier-protein] dehydratase